MMILFIAPLRFSHTCTQKDDNCNKFSSYYHLRREFHILLYCRLLCHLRFYQQT